MTSCSILFTLPFVPFLMPYASIISIMRMLLANLEFLSLASISEALETGSAKHYLKNMAVLCSTLTSSHSSLNTIKMSFALLFLPSTSINSSWNSLAFSPSSTIYSSMDLLSVSSYSFKTSLWVNMICSRSAFAVFSARSTPNNSENL